MEWYLKVLKQYADFGGRARRKEYWMFGLFNIIFCIAAVILDNMTGLAIEGVGYGAIYALYVFAMLIPGLAVAVRRLHDVGKSGWMLLIIFIPIVGAIWLLVLLVTESELGNNQYGANPKNGCKQLVNPSFASNKPLVAPKIASSQPTAASQNKISSSILDKYRAGLSYLDRCGTFDEAKLREVNRITGNRFSEADIENQLRNAKLMIGGMEEVKQVLRSTMVEGISMLEKLERQGIDLSKYDV